MSRYRPLTDQEAEATARLMQAFADAANRDESNEETCQVAIGRLMHIYANDRQRAAMEQIRQQGETSAESTDDLLIAKLLHILGPNKRS